MPLHLRSRLRFVVLGLVLSISSSAGLASTIIDDDFTGTNPGSPPGWTVSPAANNDSYDDSGATSVELQATPGLGDERALIYNDTHFDASNGIEWTIELDSLANHYLQAGVGEDLSFAEDQFGIRFFSSGSLQAFTRLTGGSFNFISLATVGSYSGGAIDLSVQALSAGFRIFTNTGFDTGLQSWNLFSNGYTVADQDDSQVFIQVDAIAASGTNTGVFDRVTLATVPEPSSMALVASGLIGLSLSRTRRRRESNPGPRSARFETKEA